MQMVCRARDRAAQRAGQAEAPGERAAQGPVGHTAAASQPLTACGTKMIAVKRLMLLIAGQGAEQRSDQGKLEHLAGVLHRVLWDMWQAFAKGRESVPSGSLHTFLKVSRQAQRHASIQTLQAVWQMPVGPGVVRNAALKASQVMLTELPEVVALAPEAQASA